MTSLNSFSINGSFDSTLRFLLWVLLCDVPGRWEFE